MASSAWDVIMSLEAEPSGRAARGSSAAPGAGGGAPRRGAAPAPGAGGGVGGPAGRAALGAGGAPRAAGVVLAAVLALHAGLLLAARLAAAHRVGRLVAAPAAVVGRGLLFRLVNQRIEILDDVVLDL